MHDNFTSVHAEKFSINFLQCYSNGNLKYTELFNLLQMVAANHADLGGIGLANLQENNQAWVLAKMLVEIKNMPKWKDEITIITWIKSLENSKSVRCFEVVVNEQTYVGVESLWVIINTIKRKPENLVLPSEHFETFADKSAVAASFSNPKALKNSSNSWNKRVVLSDLDIVNHVNNVKYIEWCLDCLTADFVLSASDLFMEMHFLREMVWNDSVQIDQEDQTFYVTKNGKNCFILSIK